MIRQRLLTNEELGELIKTMRQSRGLSQKELAELINQSKSTVAMYESGQRRPSKKAQEALADTFNVGLSSLLFTQPTIDDIDEYLDALPKTEEARILSKGIDQLPEEQRKQAVAMFDLMFAKYIKFKEKEKNENDT